MHPASVFGHHEGLGHVRARVRVRHGVIDQIHAGFSKRPQHGLGPLWFGIAMVLKRGHEFSARPPERRASGLPEVTALVDGQIPHLGVGRGGGRAMARSQVGNDDLHPLDRCLAEQARKAAFRPSALLAKHHANAQYAKSGLVVKNKTPIKQSAVHTDSKKIFIENMSKAQLSALTPVLGANYLNPKLSPDGKKIVFKVIGGNLHVYELSNFQLHDLGTGERPNWSPDSKKIIYQIATDDGHSITSSDIYLINFDGTRRTAVTRTKNVNEMRPSFFPSGKQIIYDTDLLGEIRTVKVSSK